MTRMQGALGLEALVTRVTQEFAAAIARAAKLNTTSAYVLVRRV